MPIKRKKHNSNGYTSAYYDWKNKSVELCYWKNGSRCYDSIDMDTYFYIDVKYVKFIANRIFAKYVKRVVKCSNGKYARVYYNCSYGDKQEFQSLLESKKIIPYEFDVDPVTRYMTEKPVKFGNPRVMFFDLETDSRLGFVRTDNGMALHPDARILSVAWRMSDEPTTKFLGMSPDVHEHIDDPESEIADNEETKLLTDFLRCAFNADLLVAWNGDSFDEPVLKNRCSVLGIHFDWRMVNFLDMMVMFKHPYYGYGRDDSAKGVKTSYSLDNIAKTTLGTKKLDVKSHKIFDVWKDDFENFKAYNIRDVDIMFELEKKFSYLENHKVLANVCNRFPSSRTVSSSTYLGDGLLLWYGAKNDFRFPSRKFFGDEKRHKIEGAFVLEPTTGYHKNVCCIDVGSLYPNLIRSFNISPETLDKNGKIECANGAKFRDDTKGMIPSVLDFILDKRASHKKAVKDYAAKGMDGCLEQRIEKQKSDAWKVAANSLYGLLGSPYSRIFSIDCAEAVTISGKEYVLKFAVDIAKNDGITVVYGDTDSLFIGSTGEVANEFIDVFAKKIDENVKLHGGIPGYIRLGLDAEYSSFVITSKKRYFGLKTTGKLDVKGLEIVRTDGCAYAKDFQRAVIDYFVNNAPRIEDIESIVESWHAQLCDGVDVDKIKLITSLSKEIDDYKTETIQCRVAKDLVKRKREVYTGMKIPYVVVDSKRKNSEVHVDFCNGKYDSYFYWSKQVYPPVKRILDAVWPDEKLKWKYYEKMNFADKQVDLFATNEREKIIDLYLREGDEDKIEPMKLVILKYTGDNQLRLHLAIGDIEVNFKPVTIGSGVCLCENLILELEELFGYRVYYGCDTWL